MPKEQLAHADEPLSPSIVFQTAEKNGYDEEKYKELKTRAIADNAELSDPELLVKVEERIGKLMDAIPRDSVNTFIELALRHRPAVNSMLNGFIKEIKIESQKQKKRLH